MVEKVETQPRKTTEPKNNSNSSKKALSKRTTEMPSDWSGVDKVIKVRTKPGLKFDVDVLEVNAGDRIRIDFENPDDMPHNFLIVMPETANEVGQRALRLGIKGNELGYIPDMPEVLYHTKLLQPGDSDTIYLVAPDEPGEYTFVCTYPGHYISMRGKFIVK